MYTGNVQAWLNERFAPELLEHKTEIVDCILEQIKEMVTEKLFQTNKTTPYAFCSQFDLHV